MTFALLYVFSFPTCDCIAVVFSLGPTSVSVLATLNLTLATESLAIVSTVGSISRSVISVPQASAKIYGREL